MFATTKQASMRFLIFLTLAILSISEVGSLEASNSLNPFAKDNPIKEQAFRILEAKCNVCHKKKNKRRIFTYENMDGYRKRIDKQVFKWKRMPKGRDIKLTAEEYAQLKTWITSLNQI